jgi:hypothetical protein
MFAIAFLFVRVLCDCFKSRRLLEAEVLVLRHQLNVLQQRAPHRLCLTWIDRALFVWLYRGYTWYNYLTQSFGSALSQATNYPVKNLAELYLLIWKKHSIETGQS